MKHPERLAARTRNAAQDTAAGCRKFAAADLARSALVDTENGRRRLETSSLSWANRALLIQRLDDSYEARRIVAKAERADGEIIPGLRS